MPIRWAARAVEAEEKTRVHVELPNHFAVNGETFLADREGTDRYRLANVPFYAYGLNYRDVVLATANSDGILTIRNLVEPSGYRTLRVLFDETLDEPRQQTLLDRIFDPQVVSFERATSRLVAVCIAPSGDHAAVIDQLDAWSAQGLLGFETCHPRVEGSFDGLPPNVIPIE